MKTLNSRIKRQSAGLSTLACDTLIYIVQKQPTSSELVHWLGLSLATVNRILADLRNQGYEILPVRLRGQWRYELRTSKTEAEILDDPLLKSAGTVKKWRALPHEAEDAILYLED